MSSRGTRAIVLVSLGHFTIEICHSYLPVYYSALVDRGLLGLAQVGVAALVATVASSLTQPLFGHWSDRWDARRMASVSVLWLGILMALMGLVGSNYSLLLVAVALAGFGSAAFHPAGASVVTAHSGARKGAAVSIFSVGGNVGAALSPLLIGIGLGIWDLRGTLILLPVALLAGGLIFWGLGQDHSQQQEELYSSRQAQRGFLLGLVLLVLAIMTRSWFQVGLMTYLPTWVVSQGGTVAEGGRLLFAFSICVGAGSLAGGALSDRVGRWQVLLGGLLLIAPLHWIFLQSSGVAAQMALAGGLGFLVGTSFPVAVVLAQEIWPAGTGMAAGAVMGLGWMPGGIGASITGLVAERVSLDYALQLLMVPPLIGVVCLVAFVVAWRAHLRSQPAFWFAQSSAD